MVWLFLVILFINLDGRLFSDLILFLNLIRRKGLRFSFMPDDGLYINFAHYCEHSIGAIWMCIETFSSEWAYITSVNHLNFYLFWFWWSLTSWNANEKFHLIFVCFHSAWIQTNCVDERFADIALGAIWKFQYRFTDSKLRSSAEKFKITPRGFGLRLEMGIEVVFIAYT